MTEPPEDRPPVIVVTDPAATGAVVAATISPADASLLAIARALTIYGAISLVVAVVVLLGTALAWDRITRSTDRLVDRIERVATTVESSAAAIDEAADASSSFARTIDELAPTLERTVTSLGNGATTLREFAAAAERISILGNRPLASTAASLRRTADDLDGVSASLAANTATLDRSTTSLRRIADVLPPVAADLRTLTDQLAPDVEDLMTDARLLVVFAGIGFALWIGVPGAGAIALGRRLRAAVLPGLETPALG